MSSCLYACMYAVSCAPREFIVHMSHYLSFRLCAYLSICLSVWMPGWMCFCVYAGCACSLHCVRSTNTLWTHYFCSRAYNFILLQKLFQLANFEDHSDRTAIVRDHWCPVHPHYRPRILNYDRRQKPIHLTTVQRERVRSIKLNSHKGRFTVRQKG